MTKPNQKNCVPIEWTSQVFPKLAAKIAANTIQGKPDECWSWGKRSRTAAGYGLVALPIKEFGRNSRGATKPTTVSRALMFLREGRELQGLDELALHTCDHPWCCNPAHLYVGTQQQNMADKLERHPASHGEAHPSATISDAGVAAVREEYAQGGVLLREVALKHNISREHAGRIVRGTTRSR